MSSCRLLRRGYGRVVAAEQKVCWRDSGSVVAAGFTNQVPRAGLADQGEMPAVGVRFSDGSFYRGPGAGRTGV